ncbi:MAG TPA: hypothetical protein VJJ22_03705 [Candidatus Paceibacterota bacterium]
MDVNPGTSSLRTSFIPKSNLSNPPRKKEGSSFITFISIAVLMVSLLGWLAAYGYKYMIAKDVQVLEQSITKARESFDPSLLKVFENLDRRLIAANGLLESHSKVLPIFDLLDRVTLKSVKYSYLGYVNNGIAVSVKITGEAINFESIALLALEYNKSGKILNPIISNLGVLVDGKVTFNVAFNVDSSLVSYVAPKTKTLEGI